MKNLTQCKDFSARLELAMKKRNLRQAELARQMGTAYSTVSRWLENSRPRARTVRELADLLCVSQKWLQDGVGEMIDNDPDLTPVLKEDEANYGSQQKAIIQSVADAAKNASAPTLWERIADTSGGIAKITEPWMRLKISRDLITMIESAIAKDQETINNRNQ
jgi:transcriptional regulator with XRE-family HTH domain